MCAGDSYLKVVVTDSHNNKDSAQYFVAGSGSGLNKSNNNFTEMITTVPKIYSLTQNYPNPFNPTTEIKYALKEDGNVTIRVYDALGKIVATLINGNKPAGLYSVNFDASNLSSGIYFYTIRTKNFFDRKKMVVMK